MVGAQKERSKTGGSCTYGPCSCTAVIAVPAWPPQAGGLRLVWPKAAEQSSKECNMRSPEQPDITDPILDTADQYQSLADMPLLERMRRDDGIFALPIIAVAKVLGFKAGKAVLESSLTKKASAVALVGVVGAGIGAWQNFDEHTGVEKQYSTSAEPAVYRGAFMFQRQKTCYGGYQATTNTGAEYNAELNLFAWTIDPGYKFSVNKQSLLTEVICVEEGASKVTPGDDGTVNVSLDKDDFTSYVFPANPLNDKIETGNGIGSAPQAIMETIGKAVQDLHLPLSDKLPTGGSDDITSVLEGYATLTGTKQVTEQCSVLAFEDLGGNDGPLADAIAEGVAKQANIDPSQVNVKIPDAASIKLRDQNYSLYKEVLSEGPALDGTFTLTPTADLKCIPSPDHNQVVILPAGASQPSVGGEG